MSTTTKMTWDELCEEMVKQRQRAEAAEAENAKLKEENDHLDNVIQGLHHDLDVLREI